MQITNYLISKMCDCCSQVQKIKTLMVWMKLFYNVMGREDLHNSPLIIWKLLLDKNIIDYLPLSAEMNTIHCTECAVHKIGMRIYIQLGVPGKWKLMDLKKLMVKVLFYQEKL